MANKSAKFKQRILKGDAFSFKHSLRNTCEVCDTFRNLPGRLYEHLKRFVVITVPIYSDSADLDDLVGIRPKSRCFEIKDNEALRQNAQ